MDEKIYGERWRVLKRLGNGGQGVVFEVQDIANVVVGRAANTALANALSEFDRVQRNPDSRIKATDHLIDSIRNLIRGENLPRGALKELLPIHEAVNAKTAIARMHAELETLKSIQHPALVRVLDDKLDQHWFVMELLTNGDLSARLKQYEGQVLQSLRAFEPIVSAVAALHKAGIVHRDIKPANIYLRADGSLVLGDCGLALKLENVDRLTTTFENVGTRDFQPAWSYGRRLEDVKPTFDVFSLGKLLWSMISGRPGLPLWYFDRPPNDLRVQFPENAEVELIHRILQKTVAEHEADMRITDGTGLLEEVRKTIQAIDGSTQLPSKKRKMNCRFCGVGEYKERGDLRRDGHFDPADRQHTYECGNCGHLATFYWHNDQPPVGWIG
jgi:serine/threonine protein kinase